MREEIIKKLSVLTAEELESTPDVQKGRYSKSGRFIIERRTVSDISTGDQTAPICLRAHPRFYPFPEHTHDYIEIMYVCTGSIVHDIDKKSVTVCAGELLLLGANAKHSIRPPSASDIGINIIISTELFEIMLGSLRQDASVNTKYFETLLDKNVTRHRLFRCSQSLPIQNLMESLIFSHLFRESTDEYLLEQSIKMLLYYLSSTNDTPHTSEEIPYSEQMKRKISKYIRTSYSTATLTECAKMLGLSPTYLSRWVCSYFEASFKELLMQERFSVACDLLRNTDTPIGDIITHIGYENSSYFHREFKKRFNTTPNAYRKRAKNSIR